MDPVVMLDHFHMTAPTFAPHPHAGISAVTLMFEDAGGAHMNYDSIGNIGPIKPGDLHWMVAGRGVVHTEQPEGDGFHVHALQIFVNLPSDKKFIDPYAIHVDAQDIPVFQTSAVRVRVAAGETNGVRSPAVLPEPFTLLDGFLKPGGTFNHTVPSGWNVTWYAVSGEVRLVIDGEPQTIPEGMALSVAAGDSDIPISTASGQDAHFVVLSGPALNEPIVKHGPFVMNTPQQIQQVVAAYAEGKMGQLTLPAPGQ
ncbi:pirin family protein [Undibacterium arcticum]